MSRREKLYCAITILLTIAVATCCGLFFWRSFYRVYEALRDFALAVGGMCVFVFGIKVDFDFATVNASSHVLTWETVADWEYIKEMLTAWGKKFVDGRNFLNYIMSLFKDGYMIILVGSVLIVVALVCLIIGHINMGGYNHDIGKESRPLVLYKKIEARIIYPIMRFFTGYVRHVKDSQVGQVCLKICALIFLTSLNLPTIVIELLANYVYIMWSFDFGGLWVQFTKLLLDLSVLGKLPLIVWAIGVVAYMFIRRKKQARRRLFSRDGLNCELVRSFSTSICVSGVMGAGKTRFCTAVAMIKQRVFRDSALSSMLEIKSLFPEYDWSSFEKLLRESRCRKIVDVEIFVRNYTTSWMRYHTDSAYRSAYDAAIKAGRVHAFIDYDVTFGATRNNGLKQERLTECLVDYAKLFFIYDNDTSLIFSNYAICVRTGKADMGNFPLWQYRDFEPIDDGERRQNSHVLDFNMLRLGKRVGGGDVEKDNVLEFGVLAMQEMDKERGNQNDTREMKISDEQANPKNDGFNSYIKMSNHVVYIRGNVYFFDINDMQRLDSINADFRELGEQIMLSREGDRKLLLPYFELGELLYWIFVPWWTRYYTDFRFRRGDVNLTFYIMDKFASAVERHYKKMYNEYSCIEQGVKFIDRNDSKTFYILPKQIYSGVYARDTMGDFFKRKSRKGSIGINEIPVYNGVKATYDELKAQNAYMVKKWTDALETTPEDDAN